MGKKWKQWQIFFSGRIFLGLQNHCGWWLQPQNQKTLAPSKKSYDKHGQCIKKERETSLCQQRQSYRFSRSHVRMCELNHKEGWALKNWCFWTVVLEKTLVSPLDSNVIRSVSPKGNQFWIFIGETEAEAEAPKLLPPDMKSQFIGKDPDAGKDWRWEEKGMTEDEMVGWRHRLNGHEFEQTPGVGDGQGGLVCCGPWGRRVRHDWAT